MAKNFQKRKKKNRFKKHHLEHHFEKPAVSQTPGLLTQPEEIAEPKELVESKEITEPKKLAEPKELSRPEKEPLPLPIKRDLKRVFVVTVVSLIILAALFLIFKYVPSVQNWLDKIKV